jgi:hypothetical protein
MIEKEKKRNTEHANIFTHFIFKQITVKQRRNTPSK